MGATWLQFWGEKGEIRPYRPLYVAVIWIFTPLHANGNNSGIFIFIGNGNWSEDCLFQKKGKKQNICVHINAVTVADQILCVGEHNTTQGCLAESVLLLCSWDTNKSGEDSFTYRHTEAWCFCLWHKTPSVWLEDIPHRWAKRHLLCTLWRVSVTQIEALTGALLTCPEQLVRRKVKDLLRHSLRQNCSGADEQRSEWSVWGFITKPAC